MRCRTQDQSQGEGRVSTAEEIARRNDQLRPSDTLVMADGMWTKQAIVCNARCSALQPITVRAQTPGKVVLVWEFLGDD